MARTVLPFFVLFLALPLSLAAESIPVAPGVALEVELPGQRWEVTREAPEFLVEDMAGHLAHELEEKGKSASHEQLRGLAKKRLASDELFVFNRESGARLQIDFSSLREGEKGPSRRAVKAAAKYAGESLSSEEGVSGLSTDVSRATVAGAEFAYRLDAEYMHHGARSRFVGLIGFAEPNWFYFYYTDPLKDARDLEDMETILKSLSIRAAADK